MSCYYCGRKPCLPWCPARASGQRPSQPKPAADPELAELVRAWDLALDRWVTYEREAALANRMSVSLADPVAGYPMTYTVTLPREKLQGIVADYEILLNFVAEILGKKPKEITVQQIVAWMQNRAYIGLCRAQGRDPTPYGVGDPPTKKT